MEKIRKTIMLSLVLVLCLCSMSQAQSTTNYCVVIDNRIELKDSSQESSKTISNLNKGFGKSFDIIDEYKPFVKIRIDENTSGWIKGVEGSTILRNVANSTYVAAEKKKGLYKKSIVVNKIEESSAVSEIKIYPNSSLQGDPITKVTLFELRYVFAETSSSVLVGFSDVFYKDNSELVLNGWIDKKFHQEWNNRIGVEFDKTNFQQRNLGNIFYNEAEIFNRNIADPLYQEERSEIPMPYYANRFPVIERLMKNNITYYNIAFIGGGVAKNIPISSSKIEAGREQIGNIVSNNTLRLVALIDATQGMRDDILNLKEALKEFFSSQRDKDKNLLFQAAIATYRDYPDGENIFKIACEFTDNLDSLTNAIDSISVASNDKDRGIGTYPEALFYGLNKTIDYISKTSPQKGEKYILLIGDHGNHEDYSQYPQDKEYNETQIAARLKDNTISLYAVQVHFEDRLKKYSLMFEKQIKRIIGTEADNIFESFEKVEGNSKDRIKGALNKSLAIFKAIKELLECIRRGKDDCGVGKKEENAPNDAISINLPINNPGYRGHFSQRVLERYKINPEIFKTMQGCALGYSAKMENNMNMLEERVLLRKEDLDNLKVNLNNLATEIFNADKYNDINKLEDIIGRILHALSGDKPAPDEQLSEFIEKTTGIPITTDILKTTIRDLVNRLQNREYCIKAAKYFREKVLKLEQVVGEKRIINVKWDENGTFNYDLSDEPILYFFCLEMPISERATKYVEKSRKKHVWLPMEYLP